MSELQSRSRILLLSAGLMSFVLLGAGQAVMGPALPVFQKSFDIDISTAGWLISSLGIGSFLGLVGMYFIGRHVTPSVALFVMAAGAALIAASPGFLVSVLGGTTFGLGYGCVAALFNARILAAFGARGASMVSMLNAGYSIGAIAAPLVFVALGSDPRLVFGLIAISLVLTILISGKAGGGKAPARVGGGQFRFDLPILAFGLVAIGIEVSLAGLGPSAMIRAGIPADRAAGLLSAFFVAFLAGRLALTVLADRIPAFAVYTLACLLTSAFALGCAVIGPGWFFVPMGLSAGLFFPGYYVTATLRMGDDPRVAPVILATCQIGAVFTPLGASGLIPLLGDRGFFWLVTVAAGLIGLLAAASYRRMVRPGVTLPGVTPHDPDRSAEMRRDLRSPPR